MSEQVEDILRSDHARIIAEIQAVNGTLTHVMSRLQGLGPLAATLAPEITLSNFALSALCHFDESKVTHMISHPDGGGVQFENSGGITHDEPRFLNDDMEALENCGFIKTVNNDMSYSVYEITRRGASYARLVRSQIEQKENAQTLSDF